jgi:hypothetical protein
MRVGNPARTTTGTSTPATATPLVATTVAAIMSVGPPRTRSTSPAVMAESATAIAPRSPTRRESRGATAPAAARHSTGTVVSSPTQPALAANADRAWSSSGPTLVIAGRRLKATRITATASRTDPALARPARAASDRVVCSATIPSSPAAR